MNMKLRLFLYGIILHYILTLPLSNIDLFCRIKTSMKAIRINTLDIL